MANFKKVLPFAILGLIAILVFAFLAAPVYTIKIDGVKQTDEDTSVYKYIEDYKEDMPTLRKMYKENKEEFDKLKANNQLSDEEIKEYQEQLDFYKSIIGIYDSYLAIIALAAICLAVSLAAIALTFLKNCPQLVKTILAILAVALMLSIFICACVNIADLNTVMGEPQEGSSVVPVASIVVLVFTLLASLGSGTLVALGMKKKKD